MTASNLGCLMVTYDELGKRLGLPDSVVVSAVVPQDAIDIASGRFRILIAGPPLPLHYGGSHPLVVGLMMDGQGRMRIA